MAKPEWGAKHTCLGCTAKFYDMGRNPITCPSCGEAVAVAAPSRSRRARKEDVKAAAPAKPAAKKPSKDGEEALGDEAEELIDDDDDDDAAIAALTEDDDDNEDVLAEADINKAKISDE